MKRSCLAAVVAMLAVCAASADLYSPDSPLSVLETEYFSFIFPADSRSAVEYLAGFADDAYREIAALLGTEPSFRMPVAMTPDNEDINGYYTWQPYPRIVLYQTVVDGSSTLGSFNDNLKKLFYHELTHAVSMNIRSGLENAVVGVFGSPLGASNYLTPLSFIEGVTVSFESRDGFGRATDPLAAAYIRQDIIEGRWKTFTQASGAYDLYPSRGLYYIYGGYFSRYLQERFGMEAYAEMWRRFGITSLFRPLDDSIFGDGRFSAVFGVSLSVAWNDFRDSMTPRTPVYMAAEPLRKPSTVGAISGRGDALYYADPRDTMVYRYDTTGGNETALFRAGSGVTRIDVSAGGGRLLLSTMRYESDFPKTMLAEWDAATGKLRDLGVRGMRDAAWMADGSIIGIEGDGYATNLAIDRAGARTTLLAGTERIGYSSPVAAADGRTIYAIATKGGVASVIRVGLAPPADGDRVTSVERLVAPDGVTWIRYLSLGDDGVLRFAWDDSSFYRLAELDDEEIRYQTVPVSGGAHAPVAAGGRVYYLGRFSEGTAPCSFPSDRMPLGFISAVAAWEDASELLSAVSVYDFLPSLEVKPYTALRWLAPRFWLPEFSGDLDGLTTIGARLYIADPAERLDAEIGAGWNLGARAVDADFTGTWSRFDWPVTFSVSDSFSAGDAGTSFRTSSAVIGLSGAHYPFRGGDLTWNIASAVTGWAAGVPGGSAYAWWQAAAAAVEASVGWSDTTSPLSDAEALTGYSAVILTRLDAPIIPDFGLPSAGVEAGLSGYLGTGAIRASAFGAFAATGGIAYGPGGRSYPGSASPMAGSYPAWPEFAGDASGLWFAGGEASFRLLGVEIQRGLGAFYANRLSFRAGGRGVLVSGAERFDVIAATGWSVFGRATLTWTPAIGAFAISHPTSFLEFWYRPDLDPATEATFGLTYSLSATF